MNGPDGRYAWSAKVGEKGQIVIPKEARDIFNIHPGDTLLLLGDIERGLAIVDAKKLADLAAQVFAQGNKEEPEEPK